MRKLFFNIMMVVALMRATGQIPWNYNSSGSTGHTSGHKIIEATRVYLGATTYQQSSTAELDVTAEKEIYLQQGLNIGGLSTGYAHFRTKLNGLAIASFHPNGFSNIPQYSRFELGIRLPDIVQSQIDYFIDPATCSQAGLNPYDPDKIRIECLFYAQDGSAGVKRNGFYFQQYMADNHNAYVEQPTEYQFRIRFAPPKTGLYGCNIKVYLNNSTTPVYTCSDIKFDVTDSSNPGHLSMDAATQHMRFNDQGQPYFFGIGQNIAGPDIDVDLDVSTHPNFPYDIHYEVLPNGQIQYSPNYAAPIVKASPRTHNKHRSWLNDLAANEGNFVRIRLDPQTYPVEYADFRHGPTGNSIPRYTIDQCVTNYHNNQMFLWEFDKTLAVCEANGTYIMLNILNDMITNGGASLKWGDFPYSYVINPYVDTCTPGAIYHFFTQSYTKALFKKQLYYINARWGYSTNIALWELINETENLKFYNASLDYAVKEWVCEMKAYLDGFYPRHLVTNGTIYTAFNDGISCLDVYSTNAYSNEIQHPGSHFNLKDNYHKEGTRYYDVHKPFVYGEIGLGVQCMPNFAGTPHNRWTESETYNDRSFHNNIWASTMGGNIATALNWWDWDQQFNVQHRANFNALRKFTDQIEWGRILEPKRYDVVNGTPNKTDGIGLSGEYHELYNFYMKSATSDYVVGWSMLQSSFWPCDNTNPVTGQPIFPNFQALLDCVGMDPQYIQDYDVESNAGEPAIKILGMTPNKAYRIEIFDTYYASVSSSSWPVMSTGNGVINFHINFKNHEYPDRAYIVHDDLEEYFARNPLGEGDRLVVQYEGDLKDEQNHNRSSGAVTSAPQDKKLMLETKNINVFPNPASDVISIDYNESYFTNVDIFVYDVAGKLVRKTKNTRNINVRDFDHGLYMVTFKSDQLEKSFKISVDR